MEYTQQQARYFAEQILLKRSQSSVEGLASAMSGVKVDLNPHQVDAALFAMKSPLGNGVIMADEVGLGKTIEAGLVLAQYWSERKRKILLIVPASLRMQWRGELNEKFFIDSVIMESASFNKLKKAGKINPFDVDNQVVICSYNFAAGKESEIRTINWDLVIIDEAHRLRNVYKNNNVTGRRLKEALKGRKKLLLTATPLQNNLMELYGLVSIIDEHVFGDAKTFRDMYVSVSNADMRNYNLKKRLAAFCRRTLRKQVTEYVRYTNRIAILQEYSPTEAEEKLYNQISDYLQTKRLYALPEGQRTLITMVLRKLLASSSFAIAGTLNSLIKRLENMLQGIESEPDLEDYDRYSQLKEDSPEAEDETIKAIQDREGIIKELELLKGYSELAESIETNSKGDNLLAALEKGFKEIIGLGGQQKAVIFTESGRTQEYLFNLLSNHGYEGKIVFLNGTNNDDISKRIYADWKERHAKDGSISGSRQADIKAAVVEEFRENASILIGTEAAAEGINLQFCSIVVNYDLPWNPQRIEQRIGRCHRYGQKNDVVVINFLNKKNAADVRVYELLDQKFKLFSGVFGSSDEVLGSIESGVDFEKRIAAIYQKCKTSEDIQKEFDLLQEEMAESINEKMVSARQSILENFDEEVAARLKECQHYTAASLNQFAQWIYYFFLIHGAERVEPLSEWRFTFKSELGAKTYNLNWQSAEQKGDVFLRKDDELMQSWLKEAIESDISDKHIKFKYSSCNKKIGFLDNHKALRGVISFEKMSYSGIGEEEHMIISVAADDGTVIDDDIVNKIMELPAEDAGEIHTFDNPGLEEMRNNNIEELCKKIEEEHKRYFLEECEKLDAYSEDLKDGLQRDIKELGKTISEKKKEFKSNISLPLSEMVEMKAEITALEEKRKKMRRELYDKEDEIDAANERLQDEIRAKLNGERSVEHIMTISFEIV